MNSSQWQYQESAEPLSQVGENITLDKWFVEYPDALPKKIKRKPQLTTSFEFSEYPSEFFRFYSPSQSQPQFRKKFQYQSKAYVNPSNLFMTFQPNQDTFDWLLNSFKRLKQLGLLRTLPSNFFDPYPIPTPEVLFDWIPYWQIPVIRKELRYAFQVWDGLLDIDLIPPPPPTNVADWMHGFPDLRKAKLEFRRLLGQINKAEPIIQPILDDNYFRRYLNDVREDTIGAPAQLTNLNNFAQFRDNFNRANSNTIGAGWIDDGFFTSSFAIVSRELRFFSGGDAYLSTVFSNNQGAQLTLSDSSITRNAGIAIRKGGSNYDDFTAYLVIVNSIDGTWELRKYINESIATLGTGVLLDSGSGQSFINGTKLILKAYENNIIFLINGILISTVIDSDISSGTMGIAGALAADPINGTFKEFLATDINSINDNPEDIIYFRRYLNDI